MDKPAALAARTCAASCRPALSAKASEFSKIKMCVGSRLRPGVVSSSDGRSLVCLKLQLKMFDEPRDARDTREATRNILRRPGVCCRACR
eukprot:6655454-Prymnesium_polylepis.1